MGVEATKDLVNRARVGDGGAFSQLVELYRDRLECLIHLRMGARLRKRIEVDDVFQETLLRAWQSAQDFRWGKNGSFFRWLGGIAEHVIKNLARRHFKTRKRDPHREVAISRLEALGEESSGGAPSFGLARAKDASPSKGVRRTERFNRLEMALEKLSDSHREVIVLAFIQELSVKEISLRMGRAPAAVSMLIFRALGKLRAILGNTESFHLPEGSLLRASVTAPGFQPEPHPGGSGGS